MLNQIKYRKRIKGLFCLGFFALLFLTACKEKKELPSRETLVQQALTKRVNQYQQSHSKRCRNDVMRKAKILVDSTMLANASQIKVVDSIPRPLKPIKPESPIPKTLEDSTELAPLLPLDSMESR